MRTLARTNLTWPAGDLVAEYATEKRCTDVLILVADRTRIAGDDFAPALFAPPLSRYTVALVDLPGTGRNPMPNLPGTALHWQAAAVAALAAHFRGRRIHLAAHGTGLPVALAALGHPAGQHARIGLCIAIDGDLTDPEPAPDRPGTTGAAWSALHSKAWFYSDAAGPPARLDTLLSGVPLARIPGRSCPVRHNPVWLWRLTASAIAGHTDAAST